MNILRELRKIKKKSVLKKLLIVLIFSFIFIANTFAWWNISKEIQVKKIEGKVKSWDVQYVVKDNEALNEIVKIPIANIQPGMPNVEENIKIVNTGILSTEIEYEITSVKLFGIEMINELKQNNEIISTPNGGEIFTNKDKYPFNLTYSFDKTELSGEYIDETSIESYANLKINLNWEYLGNNVLDTKIGKKAYEFYNANLDTNKNALELRIKLTSSKI